jgi:hypothetical protein
MAGQYTHVDVLNPAITKSPVRRRPAPAHAGALFIAPIEGIAVKRPVTCGDVPGSEISEGSE